MLSDADTCAECVDQVEQFPLAAVTGEDGLRPGDEDPLHLPSAVCALEAVGSGVAGGGPDELVQDADCGCEVVLGGALHGVNLTVSGGGNQGGRKDFLLSFLPPTGGLG